MSEGHAAVAMAKGHMHKVYKRQAAASTTTRRRVTASSTAAAVAPAADTTAAGRSGVANTATGAARTRVAPTTPPNRTHSEESVAYSYTFATRVSESYHPGVSAAGQATALASPATVNAADSTAPASSSAAQSSSAPMTLSTPALIGIIAGGSALVVLVAVVVGCCCWKRKKAKNEEAWRKLNENQSSVAVFNIGRVDDGTTASQIGSERRTGAATPTPSRKKSWSGAWDGGEKGTKRETSRQPQQFGHQQQHSFAMQEQANLQAARAELFGSARRVDSVGSEFNNGIISFNASPQTDSMQYPPPPPTRNLTDVTPHYSSASLATTAAGEGPRRPSRRTDSEVPLAALAPPLSRDERRQVDERDEHLESRFRAVMTGAVGRPDSAALSAEREADEARARAAAEEEQRREEQRRKKDTIANLADAYGGSEDSGWGEDDKLTALPKRSVSRRVATAAGESMPPSTTVTRRQPTAARYSSRVDSKPLRELEDILDSFHNDESSEGAAGASMRTNSVLSGVSTIGPLNVNRAGAKAALSTASTAAYGNARSYAPSSHLNSVSSSLQDYMSVRGVSTSPSAAPVTDANGAHPLAPRLTRNPSLRKPVPASPPKAELSAPLSAVPDSPVREVYSQLGLNDSPTSTDGVPSFGHSPATTPLTPQFQTSPWDRADLRSFDSQQKQPQLTLAAPSWEPLSSLSADTSYRSATLSIYGMYDEDDAPELKGLPMDDPRVSRHLSQLHAPRVIA